MRVSKRLFEVHATIKMNSFMDNIDIKLLLFVVIAAVFIKKNKILCAAMKWGHHRQIQAKQTFLRQAQNT